MKVGIIGFGSIGRRHAHNLLELGHTIYVYDPDDSMGRSVESEQELIEKSDAVVIASPTTHHFAHLLMARDKPVFVEKPIAATMDQLIILGGKSYPLMCGYNQRFNSAVKQAKAWLDGGLIGSPTWATFCCAQYNDKPQYLRDGVVLNWSHEIDLALYLLGPAKVHSAAVSGGEHDDAADILLSHQRSVISHIHLDYVTKPERRGFAIGGPGGWIEVNLPERRATLHVPEAEEGALHYWDTEGSYDQDYKDEMQAFIDRIDGKETIGCTGQEALDVLEICLKVREMGGYR